MLSWMKGSNNVILLTAKELQVATEFKDADGIPFKWNYELEYNVMNISCLMGIYADWNTYE